MFFLDYLAFLVSFRGLSSSHAEMSPAARLAVGLLVVYALALVTFWFTPSAWALLAIGTAAAVGSIGIHGEGLAPITAAFGRLRFPIYLLSVATLAALIFLVTPITTFLTSPGEIGLHLDYLISVNARDAMLIVYVAAAVYALALTPRMRTVLTIIASTALALGILYAYVLPFGYPKMSGLTFEQIPVPAASLIWRALVDVTLVIAVALGICGAVLRFGARPILMGILLSAASMAAVAMVSVARNDTRGGAGGAETEASVTQPLRFSKTHPNVLILFLDRFMGSYVESILQSDPDLATRLSGFTWYPRSVAAGENSIAGLHPLLGGYDYTPLEMNARGKPLVEQSTEAFSILPHNFSRKGWRVNVVSPRGLGFTVAGDCRYLQMPGVTCSHIPASVVRQRAEQMGFPLNDLSRSSYAELLVLLGSMRATPYLVKEVVYRRGPWRVFLDHSAGTTFRQWAELDALDELSLTQAAEPNFNFVSNILPHEPYFMGEDCQPQRTQFRVPDEEVRRRGHESLFSLQHAIAARCTLLVVADYLDFLKQAGVYDNTKIVIVSDHGIVGPVSDQSSRAVAGGTQHNMFVRTRSVLLVKEINATGELQISDAFMPNAEVPRIVCEEIGGCVNPYLNDKPIRADGRDDPFHVLIVPWQFTAQEPNAFVINAHLVLRGKDPYEFKNWERIR
jgi:hypothetical protein